jgi:hypothetical protein
VSTSHVFVLLEMLWKASISTPAFAPKLCMVNPCRYTSRRGIGLEAISDNPGANPTFGQTIATPGVRRDADLRGRRHLVVDILLLAIGQFEATPGCRSL